MKDHFPLYHIPLIRLHYSAGIIFLLQKQVIVAKYTIRYNSQVSHCWKKPTRKPTILQYWKDLLFGISKRWIAGYTAKDAISAPRKSNELGMSVVLNYPGEENLDNFQIRKSVSEYLMLLDLLNANNILGCISIKPSQVGLAMNYELCLRNIYRDLRFTPPEQADSCGLIWNLLDT